MQLPSELERITPYPDSHFPTPYPPLGFLPFWEHQLGNGDMFGLYWPIGKEDQEPIVAEIWHDAWAVAPHFSTLRAFLAAADQVEEDELVETPSVESDPRSPRACFLRARDCLKRDIVGEAIGYLEEALEVLPEYTDASTLIATQYRRVGRIDDAIEATLQSLISPPSFGSASAQMLKWLSRQTECPNDLKEDPIWQNRQRLKWQFGGEKHNEDYPLLKEAMEVYISRGQSVRALTLMQTYGELMQRETVSFQERYGFVAKEHVEWEIDVSSRPHGRLRVPQI